MMHLITNKKNVIKIALLLILFFIATTYLLELNTIDYEKKNTQIVHILTLLWLLINSFYSLVIIQFSKDLAIWDYNFYEAEETDPDPKLKQLFNQIMNYVVKEKGYMNSDINKRKLAKELKTNQTYLSMALSVCGNITFTELVNENRIKYVTEEIANNSHKKFTIEHIYKNAGFKQQSTFNRVFKEYTGMTPSEYIDTQNCLNSV